MSKRGSLGITWFVLIHFLPFCFPVYQLQSSVREVICDSTFASICAELPFIFLVLTIIVYVAVFLLNG